VLTQPALVGIFSIELKCGPVEGIEEVSWFAVGEKNLSPLELHQKIKSYNLHFHSLSLMKMWNTSFTFNPIQLMMSANPLSSGANPTPAALKKYNVETLK
jgi:hypothetical protein